MIVIARKINSGEGVAAPSGWTTCEVIFPELRESEDERIRKAIGYAIGQSTHSDGTLINGVSSEEALAWLEKQEVSINKVEPKFHEGEWITNGDYTWKIVEVKPLDYILQSQYGNIVDDTISHVDEQFHSFTIEDAKDGDVLYSPCCKLLWIYKDEKTCHVGSNLNYNSGSIVINKPVCIPTDVQPATKEQRNTLMKAMTDAGYTFDFVKKELKKIEQKPTWSEEDETMTTNIIIMLKEGASLHFNKKDIAKGVDWLKSIRPQSHWKPSDEQLNNILDVLSFDNCTLKRRELLESLYNDLKKLKS